MDGFEGDVERNRQLDLAPMELKDWFEPFNDSYFPAFVHQSLKPGSPTSTAYWGHRESAVRESALQVVRVEQAQRRTQV